MAANSRAHRTSHRAAAHSAEVRLTEALAVLTHPKAGSTGPENATVAQLCRLAGVSRNSLYRYHTGILKALRKHQCRRRPTAESKARSASESLRTENASLRDAITKFAALVDHYYAASREASLLLERRERELAELRRTLKIKPVSVKH